MIERGGTLLDLTFFPHLIISYPPHLQPHIQHKALVEQLVSSSPPACLRPSRAVVELLHRSKGFTPSKSSRRSQIEGEVAEEMSTTPFFAELKKQASGYLKEKIRTARLALTDVTPAELLAEEATNGNPWGPDARTMGFISRAAFEIDDYWRIVEVLHKRLSKFDRKYWREPYKALVLLEHLLTHGPESVAGEFQRDIEVIQEVGRFQYIDERGFNWGLTVKKKSERILKLLEKGPLLKEERDHARKITRGIQGFGSFDQRWSSNNQSGVEQASEYYWRSNSHYEDFHGGQKEDDNKENSNPEAEINGEIDMRTDIGEKSMKRKASNKSSVEEASTVAEVSGPIPTKNLPEEESEPLLVRRKDEPKFELQRKDDSSNGYEYQRAESMLLLSRT